VSLIKSKPRHFCVVGFFYSNNDKDGSASCLYFFSVLCSILNVSYFALLTSSLSQAAADYVKAHLPESLKQQLQGFEREKRENTVSYASILEQRILTVDREMLDKLSANHDEAGQEGEEGGRKWTSKYQQI